MRALDKLISFIFSIIILVISIALILVGTRIIEPRVILDLISTYALNDAIVSEKLFNPITITGLVLLVLSLKTTVFLSLFRVKDRSPITVKSKNGEVQIAQDTIINTARTVAMSYDNIKDVQAKMAKKRNGVIIYAIAQVYVDTNIRELVEAVQQDIKKTIYENIGVNVVDVNIKIKNIFATKKKEDTAESNVESDTDSKEIEVVSLKTPEEDIEQIVNKPDKKVLTEAIEKLDSITEEAKEETEDEEEELKEEE
ncbi:MAG: alkaline shock response membrane anchor protein AmaP [Clostridia bacterium]|nr:alkaline shock response membrane anchor protein AmaP [Clostridia bacterium]